MLSQPYGPSSWRFARLATHLSACPQELQRLRDRIHERAETSTDPLFGLQCMKADRSTSLRFHNLNPRRAADCLVQVLQEFPLDDSPALKACCQTAWRHGYLRFITWELPGCVANWVCSQGETKSRSITWQQTVTDLNAIEPAVWSALWQLASESLGIRDLLGQKAVDGLLVPEAIRTNRIGPLVDSRGFQVVAYVKPGRKISLALDEMSSDAVETIGSSGVNATTAMLGRSRRQLLNMMYPGSDAEVTERLNELLPVCHYVSYILNDNAHETFYPSMLKPLDIAPNTILALPAIEVLRDEPAQMTGALAVNLVRTADDAWLELQTTLSDEIFDWVEQTLECRLERWQGPAETRWGWYAL